MDNLQPTYTIHYSAEFFSSPVEHLDYLLIPKPINVRDTITPYLYVIRSKTLNAYYIGIKYSRKDANPSKFWTKYGSSSKTIKECVELYGLDDFEIINVFDTDPSGNDWEFQTADSDFRLGQFESDSINACMTSGVIELMNKRSKFGSKIYNQYAIMADGTTAGKNARAKAEITLRKTNPETGLTGYDVLVRRARATKSKVNPETKMSIYDEVRIKIKESANRKCDSGLTVAQERGKQVSVSLNRKCDSGLTVAQERGIVVKTTKSKLDPITGKSIYDVVGEKVSAAANVIEENGLSMAKNKGIRGGKTKKETILSNGLSSAQNASIKAAMKKFNRTIYFYDNVGNLLISLNTAGSLLEFVGTVGLVELTIKLFDQGGGVLTFKQTKKNKLSWHLNGIEVSTVPKDPDHVHIPFTV